MYRQSAISTLHLLPGDLKLDKFELLVVGSTAVQRFAARKLDPFMQIHMWDFQAKVRAFVRLLGAFAYRPGCLSRLWVFVHMSIA